MNCSLLPPPSSLRPLPPTMRARARSPLPTGSLPLMPPLSQSSPVPQQQQQSREQRELQQSQWQRRQLLDGDGVRSSPSRVRAIPGTMSPQLRPRPTPSSPAARKTLPEMVPPLPLQLQQSTPVSQQQQQQQQQQHQQQQQQQQQQWHQHQLVDGVEIRSPSPQTFATSQRRRPRCLTSSPPAPDSQHRGRSATMPDNSVPTGHTATMPDDVSLPVVRGRPPASGSRLDMNVSVASSSTAAGRPRIGTADITLPVSHLSPRRRPSDGGEASDEGETSEAGWIRRETVLAGNLGGGSAASRGTADSTTGEVGPHHRETLRAGNGCGGSAANRGDSAECIAPTPLAGNRSEPCARGSDDFDEGGSAFFDGDVLTNTDRANGKTMATARLYDSDKLKSNEVSRRASDEDSEREGVSVKKSSRIELTADRSVMDQIVAATVVGTDEAASVTSSPVSSLSDTISYHRPDGSRRSRRRRESDAGRGTASGSARAAERRANLKPASSVRVMATLLRRGFSVRGAGRPRAPPADTVTTAATGESPGGGRTDAAADGSLEQRLFLQDSRRRIFDHEVPSPGSPLSRFLLEEDPLGVEIAREAHSLCSGQHLPSPGKGEPRRAGVMGRWAGGARRAQGASSTDEKVLHPRDETETSRLADNTNDQPSPMDKTESSRLQASGGSIQGASPGGKIDPWVSACKIQGVSTRDERSRWAKWTNPRHWEDLSPGDESCGTAPASEENGHHRRTASLTSTGSEYCNGSTGTGILIPSLPNARQMNSAGNHESQAARVDVPASGEDLIDVTHDEPVDPFSGLMGMPLSIGREGLIASGVEDSYARLNGFGGNGVPSSSLSHVEARRNNESTPSSRPPHRRAKSSTFDPLVEGGPSSPLSMIDGRPASIASASVAPRRYRDDPLLAESLYRTPSRRLAPLRSREAAKLSRHRRAASAGEPAGNRGHMMMQDACMVGKIALLEASKMPGTPLAEVRHSPGLAYSGSGGQSVGRSSGQSSDRSLKLDTSSPGSVVRVNHGFMTPKASPANNAMDKVQEGDDEDANSCGSFEEEYHRPEQKRQIVAKEMKHVFRKVIPIGKPFVKVGRMLLGVEKEESSIKRSEGCLT